MEGQSHSVKHESSQPQLITKLSNSKRVVYRHVVSSDQVVEVIALKWEIMEGQNPKHWASIAVSE